MRTYQVASLFLVSVLALAACSGGQNQAQTSGSTGTPGGSPSKRYSIAVIPKGTSHEFWKSVHAGAEKAAKELDCEITWKGPLKEDDREDQIKVVEDFITKKVDGICLAPLDDTALRVPVAEAQKQGIPVAIFDSALKDSTTVSFVATDNFKAGEMGGKKLAEVLAGKGKVILLRYQEGSASTREREEGFLAAMKANPGIEVVSDNLYAGATVETAQQASENLLAKFGGSGAFSVNGIFCPNESSTFGMLRALQNAKLAGKVSFVGFDSTNVLLEAIIQGQINALVVQNPRKMGYEAVKAMVSHLKGEKVEARIDTGAVVIEKSNMESPEIKELLTPPTE